MVGGVKQIKFRLPTVACSSVFCRICKRISEAISYSNYLVTGVWDGRTRGEHFCIVYLKLMPVDTPPSNFIT